MTGSSELWLDAGQSKVPSWTSFSQLAVAMSFRLQSRTSFEVRVEVLIDGMYFRLVAMAE